MLQRLAAGVGHLADGAQGNAKTATGDGRVHLGDLERRRLQRPQQQRWIRFERMIKSQTLEHLHHLDHVHVQPDPHRRDVIGAGQRIAHGHPAMVPLVVVGRRPALAAGGMDQRAVIDQGHQGIAIRLFQRGQIHHRLDQRTGQPFGRERPVKAERLRLAIAHHRQHLASLGVGHYRCALQWPCSGLASFQRRQTIDQRILGDCLHPRIESGEYP